MCEWNRPGDSGYLQHLLLESAGHTVRLFASAAALLESGSLAEIDCLLSDVNMPVMGGLELLRIVRTARPGLPVILVTGHPEMINPWRGKSAPHLVLYIFTALGQRHCMRRKSLICKGERRPSVGAAVAVGYDTFMWLFQQEQP